MEPHLMGLCLAYMFNHQSTGTSRGCAVSIPGHFQAPAGSNPEQPGLTSKLAWLWAGLGLKSPQKATLPTRIILWSCNPGPEMRFLTSWRALFSSTPATATRLCTLGIFSVSETIEVTMSESFFPPLTFPGREYWSLHPIIETEAHSSNKMPFIEEVKKVEVNGSLQAPGWFCLVSSVLWVPLALSYLKLNRILVQKDTFRLWPQILVLTPLVFIITFIRKLPDVLGKQSFKIFPSFFWSFSVPQVVSILLCMMLDWLSESLSLSG